MIEPLKHILDIYDKKKDTLLYYLTDDVKDIVESFEFLDDGHDLFINDNIYCIHKSTLDLDYVGRIMAIQKQRITIKYKYKWSIHLPKNEYYIFIKRRKSKKNDRDFYKALLNAL